MGKVVNHLGEVKGELNVSVVCPYCVEHVGQVVVGRRGRSCRARSTVTQKIATEPKVAVFSGLRTG